MATQRILQNNRLLWVDTNIDPKDPDTQYALEKLRTIVYHIDLFTSIDDCLRFLDNQVKNEQALIITSGSLGQQLVGKLHHLRQVDAIYIFCGNPDRHQSWASQWSKIKGVYNRIKPICEALRTAVKQTNEDFMPNNFFPKSEVDQAENSTDNLNRLEPSFMYTTLLKRILLKMKHEPDEKKAIVKFCRTYYAENPGELAVVDDFDRNYTADKAIWWYTRECFTFQLLNRSLRCLESDIIVDMGFFIHDLHRQLEQLHQEQFPRDTSATLTVYRGQALSTDGFDRLKESCGGLLAFNGFLSTSTDKNVAMGFARQASQREYMVGIFFIITMDPSIRSAIFANVQEQSFFRAENEVLFSMHTVFRIGDLIQIGEGGRLFEVRLTLTSDDDAALRRLTDRLEQEASSWETGWQQLAGVLLKIGQGKKARELYLTLLGQHPSEHDQSFYYNQLGRIEEQRGDYKAAIEYHQRAISLCEKRRPPNHGMLSTFYSNIGSTYQQMGEYSKALSYFNKALSIFEKSVPDNHHALFACYNNIGLVNWSMGEYSEALLHVNKALAILEKNLPPNHPLLATSYNNISLVYQSMGKHSEALSYFNKALAIREKSLPGNHPDLAASYTNIGVVYQTMGKYSEALSYYNKALAIQEEGLSGNHPNLATSYNNIGGLYQSMGKYSEALSYFNKALAIREKSLDAHHPDLATSYNNIGAIFYILSEYSKAESFFRKAYDIRKGCLPHGHPELKGSEEWLQMNSEKLRKQPI